MATADDSDGQDELTWGTYELIYEKQANAGNRKKEEEKAVHVSSQEPEKGQENNVDRSLEPLARDVCSTMNLVT